MGHLLDIEVEIREPTGLALGTFDLFVVRQKIYEGQLASTCEFKDAEGQWAPLNERDEFREIFWLIGEATDDKQMQQRRTFRGWQTKDDEASQASDPALDLGAGEQRGGLRALAKRLRSQGLPSSAQEQKDEQ
jgi:hypothetical protein